MKMPQLPVSLDSPKVAGLIALGALAVLIGMHKSFASVRIG